MNMSRKRIISWTALYIALVYNIVVFSGAHALWFSVISLGVYFAARIREAECSEAAMMALDARHQRVMADVYSRCHIAERQVRQLEAEQLLPDFDDLADTPITLDEPRP